MRVSPKALKTAVLTALSLGYLSGMAVLSGFAISAQNLPDPDRLWERQRPISVQIVDRHGREVLVRGAAVEQPVDLDALPFHIPVTFLATEDRRFRNHIGIDPRAISRAMVTNLRKGHYAQGGSTLTQQLSKNIFLSPEKTLSRKAQEVMLSIWLERDFTKNELLEMYLSRVYFGSGAWGLEAASRRYFDKPAAELSLAEVSVLAGLLRAPSKLNPVADYERSIARSHVVLDVLASQDLLGEGVAERAKAEPLTIHRPQNTDAAQYFVEWIWHDLEDRIGIPTQDLIVQTTLDLDAQRTAQTALTGHLDPDRNATQGAIVTLDGMGGVRTMVGGGNFADSQFNRVTQAVRQPGSAFKPFVYLTALRAGRTPWDIVQDAPITIDGWSPENFGKRYSGSVTLTEALAKSLNTVAVSLGENVGRDAVVATAEQMGLPDLQPFPSLTLGAQGTSPLAMAQAYLPFANWGMARTSYGITAISTADGTPLYDREAPRGAVVLDTPTLGDMNFMMMETVARGTGRAARVDGHDIAGKTGTTNDFRDAWFIGYAPDLVTAVWVGNDDNTPMKSVTGGSLPARIFAQVMAAQLTGAPEASLPVSRPPEWAKRDAQLNSLLDQIDGQLP